MLLSTLMSGRTPSASYEGFATADDMVLAIDVSAQQTAAVGDYAVVQMGTKSVTASLNPETKQSAYIRAGKSTTKTGNQRTIAFECDRCLGDEFQDYADSIKYATGQGAIVNYVYFNILTGKGEKGTATLTLSTDGSGNAEDPLGISGTLEKSGAAPEDYTWGGASGTHTAAIVFFGDITGVTVNVSTFNTKVSGEAGTYVFTYDGSAWSETLAQYGISVTGTPAEGDTIKVEFA